MQRVERCEAMLENITLGTLTVVKITAQKTQFIRFHFPIFKIIIISILNGKQGEQKQFFRVVYKRYFSEKYPSSLIIVCVN